MSRPATARIDLDNLRHNYRLLRERAGASRVMAVIKADAYGHGHTLVAPALAACGCRDFGVTDAPEGARLRDCVGTGHEIFLLSGIFDGEDAELARAHELTPVVASREQVALLERRRFRGRAWLKVDTGMRRGGATDAGAVAATCAERGIRLAGLMSHLACADLPDHDLNALQVERFAALRGRLGPNLAASLLNSAGIVAMPEHGLDYVRPGIALYGVEPVPGREIGLKSVMRFTGGVTMLRELERGESVSYGATFVAERRTRVAVVSLGYGDGLPRLLSNRGRAVCGGRSLPVIGRICMDHCMLDATDVPVSPGDEVEFWGESRPAAEVAESIGTIAYELFTGVAPRVRRVAA